MAVAGSLALATAGTGLFAAPIASVSTGTVYYVSTSRNDANAGTSPGSPWKSPSKVDATTFQPGDEILFQAGGSPHVVRQMLAGQWRGCPPCDRTGVHKLICAAHSRGESRLRVSAEDEITGVDRTEHAETAYDWGGLAGALHGAAVSVTWGMVPSHRQATEGAGASAVASAGAAGNVGGAGRAKKKRETRRS